MLCTEARISMKKAVTRPSNIDLEQLEEARMRIHNAPLFIDDTSGLTITEMRSRARRLAAQNPDLSMIIVDYLQLMHSGASRVESRQQEVSEISRSVKALARELNVPIVALSQLSRESEKRRGKTERLPRLSDLRESGAIEQDADLVLFIHREGVFDKEKVEAHLPTEATLRIAKQRNGEIGDIDMLFAGQFTMFTERAVER
jgi:replicative DNA helicase